MTLLDLLREQYALVFARPWPVFGAALLIGTLNVFLFAYDRPWTASDGARNWGDWLLLGLGVLDRPDLIQPWFYSASVLNLGVLAGALAAALLSREFAVRVAPGGELLKGGVGGLLMGMGAVLAFGCNVGGFFSATSALSLSGLAMMLGLGVGAWLGLRYILWELEHWPALTQGKSYTMGRARQDATGLQPWLGGALLVALVVALPYLYARSGYGSQAGLLLFGVAFGVIFQRSRFCLVRAFREPFMTGEADHTRAAALALAVSTIGFTILKVTDLKDKSEWVFPGFWAGALAGGVLFGLGMVLAGGCGAGSIWRAGEGHVKLWCAVAMFAVGASLARLVLVQAGLLQKLGTAVFLPALVGWGGAVAAVLAVMAAWYLAATWNERTQKLSLL
ncbi:MAG TPA: YeeE/YedE thiosulfate transporter family protein [Methylomirabilota bacterium]|nr:YeeE/YedE thiosulfate transporter family protein [Methylomirabilota bacterium]